MATGGAKLDTSHGHPKYVAPTLFRMGKIFVKKVQRYFSRIGTTRVVPRVSPSKDGGERIYCIDDFLKASKFSVPQRSVAARVARGNSSFGLTD